MSKNSKSAKVDGSVDSTKFKVSKYNYICYNCAAGNRPAKQKSFVMRFNAELTDPNMGSCNMNLPCPKCSRTVNCKVDTWWGGTFRDEDTIFEDTARTQSVKVSSLPDYSKEFAVYQRDKLNSEIRQSEPRIKSLKQRLEKVKCFLQKNKKTVEGERNG